MKNIKSRLLPVLLVILSFIFIFGCSDDLSTTTISPETTTDDVEITSEETVTTEEPLVTTSADEVTTFTESTTTEITTTESTITTTEKTTTFTTTTTLTSTDTVIEIDYEVIDILLLALNRLDDADLSIKTDALQDNSSQQLCFTPINSYRDFIQKSRSSLIGINDMDLP